jgi:Tfp pilus assembly protein PilF
MKKHEIPLPLLKRLRSGECMIFVGAGLSLAAGMPSWRGLVDRLRAAIPGCPRDASFTQVAEFYEILHKREGLHDAVRKLIPADVEPTAAHRHLMALRPRRIFTTNYDLLLERAAAQAGLTATVLRTDSTPEAEEADIQIVKVHGDIVDLERMVITSSNFDDFPHDRPGLAGLLKAEIQFQTSLFLGYGFGDPNLHMLLAAIRRESGDERPPVYSVQLGLNDLMRSWFAYRKLQVVDLPAKPGTKAADALVETWLRTLADEVSLAREVARTKASLMPPLGRLPNRPARFMRDAEMEKVFEALRQDSPIVVIDGFTGVGKSNLAKVVGHCCLATGEYRMGSAPRFNHVVWVSTKDRSPAGGAQKGKSDRGATEGWLEIIVGAIESATGVRAAGRSRGGGSGASAPELRTLLASEPVLLILDNFESVREPALERWLRAMPSPSRVLITTRDPHAFPGVPKVSLSGLQGKRALELLDFYCRRMGLRGKSAPTRLRLRELAEATRGNPELMNLALGQIYNPQAMAVLKTTPEDNIEECLEALLASAWQQMDEQARSLLRVTALFASLGSIRADALQAASGLEENDEAFAHALRTCIGLGLLQEDSKAANAAATRYRVHPFTLAFARRVLAKAAPPHDESRSASGAAGFELAARSRMGLYYYRLVRKCIRRALPDVPYWNALVHDGMQELDPEWPAIRQVLEWELKADSALLLELIRLLVHYMDSRFLNEDRREWVKQAIDKLRELGADQELAVMKIDALSWTLIEEGECEEAERHIREGIVIAQNLPRQERDDLLALGYAWLAHLALESEGAAAAKKLLRKALGYRCRPWIEMRVMMVYGDLAVAEGRPEEALGAYRHAEALAAGYGGEGHGYQTLPRIGFAHLQAGDYDRAEETFRALAATPQIAIGSLYAEYGLATVAYKRGRREEARAIIENISSAIQLHESHNLLSRMIGTFYETIRRDEESAASDGK